MSNNPPSLDPGLVIYNTSNTDHDSPAPLEFDSYVARFRKLKKTIITTADLITKQLQKNRIKYKTAFITLTYAPGECWEQRDISKLLNNYKMWCARRGIPCSGVWVLERGKTRSKRIHYHIILFLPRGVTPPMPDKQGWWKKGATNCKWARRPVGYLAHYASKLLPGTIFPARCRLHGSFGLPDDIKTTRRWLLAPSWVRERIPFHHGVKLVKGWYRDLLLGFEYKSPWAIDKMCGSIIRLIYLGFDEANFRMTTWE